MTQVHNSRMPGCGWLSATDEDEEKAVDSLDEDSG